MPSCIERKGHFEMREYFAEFMTKTARQPAIEPNYVCTKTKINNRGERKKTVAVTSSELISEYFVSVKMYSMCREREIKIQIRSKQLKCYIPKQKRHLQRESTEKQANPKRKSWNLCTLSTGLSGPIFGFGFGFGLAQPAFSNTVPEVKCTKATTLTPLAGDGGSGSCGGGGGGGSGSDGDGCVCLPPSTSLLY